MKKIYLITTSLLAYTNIFASLQVSTFNSAAVINFDQNVGWEASDANPSDNVYKRDTTGGTGATHQRILERSSNGWQGISPSADLGGLSAQAWQYQHDFYDPDVGGPLGQGSIASPTFEDWNSDGDTNDALSVAGLNVLKDAFGIPGNWGIGFATDANMNSAGWASMWLTLRIQNMTGFTMNNWDITLDAWNRDSEGENFSDLILSYSTNNTDFTVLQTLAGAGANSAMTFQGNAGGSFVAGVADGDYLYFRIHSNRLAGNGTAWGIDDISVTAVPEPSSYAFMLGLLTLGVIAIRRRTR